MKYVIELTFEARKFRGKVAPRGFFKVDEYFDRDVEVYAIWYLVPFIRLAKFLERQWWKPARFLRRRGYLNVQEGERCHWFWLKKITLKKKLYPSFENYLYTLGKKHED